MSYLTGAKQLLGARQRVTLEGRNRNFAVIFMPIWKRRVSRESEVRTSANEEVDFPVGINIFKLNFRMAILENLERSRRHERLGQFLGFPQEIKNYFPVPIETCRKSARLRSGKKMFMEGRFYSDEVFVKSKFLFRILSKKVRKTLSGIAFGE